MEKLTLKQQQEILANINKGIIGNRTTGHWNRIANIDWETKVANTDYKAFQAKKVANTDYKARNANIDWKVRNANTDYKTKVANTNWKIREEKRIVKVSKPILQYDKQGNFIKEWNSAKEASIAIGKPENSDIGRCCRGKGKTAHGFIWKFKDN